MQKVRDGAKSWRYLSNLALLSTALWRDGVIGPRLRELRAGTVGKDSVPGGGSKGPSLPGQPDVVHEIGSTLRHTTPEARGTEATAFARERDPPLLVALLTRKAGEASAQQAAIQVLEALRRRFPNREPSRTDIYAILTETTSELRQFGSFNYLLSDGNVLYAHCSTKLHYVLRQSPFVVAHLIDRDVTVDFSSVTTPYDKIAAVTTLPLTDNEY